MLNLYVVHLHFIILLVNIIINQKKKDKHGLIHEDVNCI